jgi:hypothetical protein
MDSSIERGYRRRLQPLNQLLPASANWATNLPAGVQPLAMMQRLPRIVNAIARLWRDSEALRQYLDDLLVDRRGGRRGLPPDIHNELLTLREFHERQFPAVPRK